MLGHTVNMLISLLPHSGVQTLGASPSSQPPLSAVQQASSTATALVFSSIITSNVSELSLENEQCGGLVVYSRASEQSRLPSSQLPNPSVSPPATPVFDALHPEAAPKLTSKGATGSVSQVEARPCTPPTICQENPEARFETRPLADSL